MKDTTNTTTSSNLSVLQDTSQIQNGTKDVLERIQRQIAESEAVGYMTLATVDEDNYKMNRMLKETNRLNENLDKTQKLQNKFGLWSLQWNNGRMARQLQKHDKKKRQQNIGNALYNPGGRSHQ